MRNTKTKDEIEVVLTDGMTQSYHNNKAFIKRFFGFTHFLLRRFRKDVIKFIINKILEMHSWEVEKSYYISYEKNTWSNMFYIYLKLKKLNG